MKSTFIAVSLLVATLASQAVQANNRVPRRGPVMQDYRDIVRDLNNRIKELSIENEYLVSRNIGYKKNLRQCKKDNSASLYSAKLEKLLYQLKDNEKELSQANSTIKNLEQSLVKSQDQTTQLKRKVIELEAQLNPAQSDFNLSDSIRACSRFMYTEYIDNCTKVAKKAQIHSNIIKACDEIKTKSAALSCVQSAARYSQLGEEQINECTRITQSNKAAQCVEFAGVGNVSPESINACVNSSTRSSLQVDCMRNMFED